MTITPFFFLHFFVLLFPVPCYEKKYSLVRLLLLASE
nr:MAG TPA: hypothetical protein [Bacteriophage sp.]